MSQLRADPVLVAVAVAVPVPVPVLVAVLVPRPGRLVRVVEMLSPMS
jgi:hypothetical protein